METTPATRQDSGAPSVSAVREELERRFGACELVRLFRRAAYDPGDRLEYAVTGVVPATPGRVVLEVERFVGGGFAGQVYRVSVLDVQADGGGIAGLDVGRSYAAKILKPPSAFSRVFRDGLYFLAYQGQFSAQVHPASVRMGVLWQKMIRRAAAREFGDQHAVCDTYATFYDEEMRSFGEINEWIDGRTWKYEVDDRLFDRWSFEGDPPADHNCPEYVHKKLFMQRLVKLLHEMGAPELARQYEWWSCKSQPNALKRVSANEAPGDGLTAVDFRAGLALLPLLPMSPVDFKLILVGLIRGRLVQFDRSDQERFRRFVEEHRTDFDDLQPAIGELQEQEAIHRSSLPDVTHHHFRLITDGRLRRSVADGTIEGWKNSGRLDAEHASELRSRRGLFALLFAVSLVPLLGRAVVKLWGNARAREHVKRCWTSGRYLWRAMRGSRIETLIVWQRKGRASDERVLRLVHQPVRYWLQRIAFGWLPATWHRAVAEPSYGWAQLREAVVFAVRFLRVPSFREDWLLEQVRLGQQEGMLDQEEAARISEQVQDPFVQKYLKSVAVHVLHAAGYPGGVGGHGCVRHGPLRQVVGRIGRLCPGCAGCLSGDAGVAGVNHPWFICCLPDYSGTQPAELLGGGHDLLLEIHWLLGVSDPDGAAVSGPGSADGRTVGDERGAHGAGVRRTGGAVRTRGVRPVLQPAAIGQAVFQG